MISIKGESGENIFQSAAVLEVFRTHSVLKKGIT